MLLELELENVEKLLSKKMKRKSLHFFYLHFIMKNKGNLYFSRILRHQVFFKKGDNCISTAL